MREDMDDDSLATTRSVMLLHAPHAGHLPYHFVVSLPHSVQKNMVLDFATTDISKFLLLTTRRV